MTDEKKILSDIFVDESDVVQNLAKIVTKAKEIFVLEKKSGKIIFKNFSKLTNPDRICSVLIGRYFSQRFGIIDDPSFSVAELSANLNIPSTTLSSPLKSLQKSGLILSEKSRYRINPHRIEDVVDSINSKTSIKKTKK